LTLTAIAFAACTSAPAPAGQPEKAKKAAPKYEVVDHKTMAIGGDIPEWLSVYMNDGVTAVEALEKYKDKIVFIGEDSGVNLPALKLWVQDFNIAKDIAKMVTTRVQAKSAAAAAGSPDDKELGRYLEDVVKASSDATFTGARKENDFWILKRYFKPDGVTVDREVYEVYVLTTIDRASFKAQLDAILNGTAAKKPVSKESQTAIDRVKESFYEGF
jgi:hypothetical protein